jgi:HupE / UreJ protein
LRRENGRWMPVGNFRNALSSVVKIVTAFTLAHSITLSLAALEVVSFPSRLVESTIAASVVLAALNNVFPVVQERRRWLVAFSFGLIHGFGFASVLTDLELTQATLLRSLVGFNVGVELGQLTIVMVFLPLAFSLRSSSFYNRFTLAIGSLAVAAIAGIWMAERIFDFKVLPI